MQLSELKVRLRIKIEDESQDDFLTVALEDAIDYAQDYCGQKFEDDCGKLDLPPAIKRGIALMVKSMRENSNVASQALGDMSKSFFEQGTIKEAHTYFNRYKKVRFF